MAGLRRKTLMYLENGTLLVWLIDPMKRSAEVCRLDSDGEILSEILDIDGKLVGEDVLSGFELELRQLFGALSA